MKSIYLLVVATAFVGCTGTTVVLKEDTESMSELMEATITATRTYYNELGKQQFVYMIEFLATHPSCNAETPLLFSVENNRCLTSDEKIQWRDCRETGATDGVCEALSKVTPQALSSQTNEERQTMVSLMATVAVYQRSLAKVLNDEKFDTGDDLKNLKSRLEELRNQVDELKRVDEQKNQNAERQGIKLPEEGTKIELDKQLEVVGELIDLIKEADEDQSDFAKLQVLVRTKGPDVDTALESLLSIYEKVDKPMADLYARRNIENARRAYNMRPPEERIDLSQEDREQLLRGIYEAEWKRLSEAAKPDSLAEGLRGLILSHKKLQEGFAGNLTQEQRERIADENLKQVEEALKSMMNIVKLFA